MARQSGKTAIETRELIVNTAYVMFGLNGFDGVSIQDISAKSKLSKGALYWHFENKEALYFECLKQFRHILRAKIFLPMVGVRSPAKQIALFFTGTNDLLKDVGAVDCAAGYLLGMGRGDKEIVTYFRERIFLESETFLSGVLVKGAELGRFNFTCRPEPLARSLWAIMEGCILQMRRQSAEEIEETMYTLWDVFTRGIGFEVKEDGRNKDLFVN
jgi:AcrR family transcriptional regulator